MGNSLAITEIKAFVPAKDFALSKAFYVDIGFTQASEGGGVAYFHRDGCSFLLQDFYVPAHSDNFMMHILVADAKAWRDYISAAGVEQKYGVELGRLTEQPWRMVDFVLTDPSGVLWRIGHNL